MVKIDRAQRRAYGKVLTTAFLLIQSVANISEAHTVHLGQSIMTEKEKLYLRKVKTKLNEDATLLREFGHRLQK